MTPVRALPALCVIVTPALSVARAVANVIIDPELQMRDTAVAIAGEQP